MSRLGTIREPVAGEVRRISTFKWTLSETDSKIIASGCRLSALLTVSKYLIGGYMTLTLQ